MDHVACRKLHTRGVFSTSYVRLLFSMRLIERDSVIVTTEGYNMPYWIWVCDTIRRWLTTSRFFEISNFWQFSGILRKCTNGDLKTDAVFCFTWVFEFSHGFLNEEIKNSSKIQKRKVCSLSNFRACNSIKILGAKEPSRCKWEWWIIWNVSDLMIDEFARTLHGDNCTWNCDTASPSELLKTNCSLSPRRNRNLWRLMIKTHHDHDDRRVYFRGRDRERECESMRFLLFQLFFYFHFWILCY